MRKYKLLKNLPDVKAGTILQRRDGEANYWYTDNKDCRTFYKADVVENNPELFEEIKEPKFKVGDIVVCSNYSDNYNGKPLMITKVIVNDLNEKFYNFIPCIIEDHNFGEYSKVRLATNDEIISFYENQGWIKGVKQLSFVINNTPIQDTFINFEIIDDELLVNTLLGIRLPIKYFELVKEEYPKTWEELHKLDGWFINTYGDIEYECDFDISLKNTNIFATEKQAKSSLAKSKLSQLHKRMIEIYNKENNCDWKADWKNGDNFNWVVKLSNEIKEDELFVTGYKYQFHHLSFPTRELAEFSLEYHRELWEKYYELE